MKGEVTLSGVTKVFPKVGRSGRLYSLKGALLHGDLLKGIGTGGGFTALEDFNLDIAPGEALGIIGPNGSGKSTALKLITGILRPTKGSIEIDGRVTALIELGAGFHPDISGRENIIINGMLLGLSRKEVEARLDDIVRFAGVGDFIDQPIRTYSSGMLVRLGFSVAVAVDPDILLVDEVLAVGDESFTRRCLDRIARMRREGVTLIIVSHDLDLVSSLTDRAIYLREGRVVQDGPSDTVVARYRSDVAEGEQQKPEDNRVRVVEEGRRWGTGDVEILDVSLSSGGVPLRVLPSGADATVHIRYAVKHPVEDFVFGIAWHRTDGTMVAGHNTWIDGIQPGKLAADGEVRCRYPRLDLAAGEYVLDVAIHAVDGLAYDYWCRVAKLSVTAPVDWPGIWAPPHRWETDSVEWEEPPPQEEA